MEKETSQFNRTVYDYESEVRLDQNILKIYPVQSIFIFFVNSIYTFTKVLDLCTSSITVTIKTCFNNSTGTENAREREWETYKDSGQPLKAGACSVKLALQTSQTLINSTNVSINKQNRIKKNTPNA